MLVGYYDDLFLLGDQSTWAGDSTRGGLLYNTVDYYYNSLHYAADQPPGYQGSGQWILEVLLYSTEKYYYNSYYYSTVTGC